MVVDDDPILCEVAKTCFKKLGALDISVAHNGRDALDFVDLQGDPFSFVLLDLNMPVMDGVQFLRHLHRRNYQGSIGILGGEEPAMLSLSADLSKKLSLDVVGPIRKPPKVASLQDLISRTDASCGPIQRDE